MKAKLLLITLLGGCVLLPAALAIGHLPWEALTLLPLIGGAVAANQVTPRSGHDSRVRIEVADAETLYGGTLVFYDATGYATATAGGNIFAGLNTEVELDNSDGDDGDLSGEVIISGSAVLVGSGFTQASVGQQAFATDNYTVTTSDSGNSYVGVITELISSTKVRVLLDVGKRVYA